MDPTQGHANDDGATVRLAPEATGGVLDELGETLVVGLLGSSLHLETGDGYLRVVGPGSTGSLTVRVAPAAPGLVTLSIDGAIAGRPSLATELRERFLRVALRRATPPPADAYCHAVGFGRECDRRKGHSGNHLTVGEQPLAWSPDGRTLVDFESRFVIEDLLDRIRTLEAVVARNGGAAGATRPLGLSLAPPVDRPVPLPRAREPPRRERPKARARSRTVRTARSA